MKKKMVHVAQEMATYVVSALVTALGVLIASFGGYRLIRSVFESSMFYFCVGSFLVLTFNREIRFKFINALPPEARKYLYEKSLIDAVLDLSVAFQSLGAILISGVLRKEEIKRLTDTLPREFQYLNQRGLVNLLPEPLQGMLNPFYSYEDMRTNRGAHLVIGDVVTQELSLPEEDDIYFSSSGSNPPITATSTGGDNAHGGPDPSSDSEATGETTTSASTRTQMRQPVARVVRGVEVSVSSEQYDDHFFVPPSSPIRAPLVPATVVDANSSSNSSSSSSSSRRSGSSSMRRTRREREFAVDSVGAAATATTSSAPPPRQIEEILFEIGMQRLSEVATRGKDMLAEAAQYCLTGGHLTDTQLLSGLFALGLAGGMLSGTGRVPSGRASIVGSYNEALIDQRHVLSGSGSSLVLRSLMAPLNASIRTLPYVLYTLSLASGGMLAARLAQRHYQIYGSVGSVLVPFFASIQTCQARAYRLYCRLSNVALSDHAGWQRAQLAAFVTTISVLVAWRMRTHWRQWRWLVAVIVARARAAAVSRAEQLLSHF